MGLNRCIVTSLVVVFSILLLVIMPGVSLAKDPLLVLVKVNGAPITAMDVEDEINRIIPGASYHKNPSPEKRESFRKQAIETLIDRELQFQAAKAKGLKPDKKKIQTWLENIIKKFPSEKEYRRALKEKNITENDLKDKIKKALLVEEVFKIEIEDTASVSDKEIRKHYEDNLTKFRELDQVKLRHIVIQFGNKDNTETNNQANRIKDEAKAVAEEIMEKISKGEDFASLAYKFSDSPYKVKGGDLGFIHKGRMLPDIEAKLFSAGNGEIIGPVEIEDGYHIFRIEDRKNERLLPFEEVKDQIRDELLDIKKQERNTEWISEMKKIAKIEYLQPVDP